MGIQVEQSEKTVNIPDDKVDVFEKYQRGNIEEHTGQHEPFFLPVLLGLLYGNAGQVIDCNHR